MPPALWESRRASSRGPAPRSALQFERDLDAALAAAQPDLIVLAGFMRILSEQFVAARAGRILNIHPSLLPHYRGLHTHRRVLEAGDEVHGASVHFVTAELDGGPLILQSRVAVRPGDDAGHPVSACSGDGTHHLSTRDRLARRRQTRMAR